MATKTFKTQFLLGAKYAGGPAFGALNRDIDRTQRNAKQTAGVFARVFGKAGTIVGALGITAAAYVAFRKTVDLGKWAFDAAKTQKKAHDIVRQSNQRLAAEGRIATKDIEKRTQETIELAGAMNKAGGLDAETLAVGLAGLNKYLSSDQIKKMADGWQDWMVKIHKGAPTMEEAAADQDNLNKYILTGKKAFLTSIGMTKEQADAIAKQVKGHDAVSRAQSRAAIVAEKLGKKTGEMARWMETDEGKAYAMENAAEDLGETMGGPWVRAQRMINIALTDLYKALGPVAELIAKEMTPALQNFTKWLGENKEQVVAFAKGAVEWFVWMSKMTVVSINDTKAQWDVIVRLWNVSITETTTQFNAFWDNIVAGSSKAWEGVKAIWGTVSAWFSNLVLKIGEAIAPVYNAIIAPFKAAFDWVVRNDPAKGYIPPTSGGREEGDYVPEIQQQGASGGSTQQDLGNQPGNNLPFPYTPTASTTISNAGLAQERARLQQEIANNPATKEKLMRVAQAEVGSSDPARLQAFLETVANQSASRKKSIDQTLSPAYYAVLRKGRLPSPSGEARAKQEGALAKLWGGSNVSDFSTGNWSGPRGRGFGQREGGYLSKVVGGEQFGVEAADVKWAKQQKSKAAAPGPQNVSMNPTINVNGVAAGSENLMADKVKQIVENNSRKNLEQLRRDRNEEIRTGYV